MSVMGKMNAASAAKAAGQRQLQAAELQQAQANQNAQQQEAAAQRKGLDETRHAQLLASRAIAIAGGGGGSVSDPSVANLLADITQEGLYRKGVQIYQGEENARQIRQGGDAALYAGQVAAKGGEQRETALTWSAIGSGISGASTIYGRFGRNGPGKKWDDAEEMDQGF